jgi:hypothetical protein
MVKSASKRANRDGLFSAKGQQASLLRRRKYELVRGYGFPEDLLGGSLTLTTRRCGKSGCRCASGDAHPMWTLTYSIEGVKQVLVVPAGAVAALQTLAEQGRRWRDALGELLVINAQLVTLWRQEQRREERRRSSKDRRR